MSMEWKVLDNDYLNYLRDNFEHRVPYSNYGNDKYKPFFGTLFELDDLVYVTQISSPKKRHLTLRQNIDFYKIYNPDDHRLISVVNLNFMFPIHKSLLSDLKYKEIDKLRTFENIKEKSKYIDLLQTELAILNTLPLSKNALKIYNLKYDYPNNDVSKRCFDFKSLEIACQSYISK